MLLEIPKEDYNEISVVGITSAEKDYKLCYEINRVLHLHMKRVLESELANVPHIIEFPLFQVRDEHLFFSYQLLANKNEKEVLITELKNIDYFLLIEHDEVDMQELMNKLRTISQILFVSEIKLSQLKDKNLLMLDF